MAQNRTSNEQKLGKPLKRAFFARSVHEVAPELIGATLLVIDELLRVRRAR